MSLLVAANLVDRIYICADTRLSRYQERDGQFSTVVEHDNLQKIIISNRFNSAVGCVGSPKLANYILEKIEENFSDIQYCNELKRRLNKEKPLILRWVDEYISKNSVPYRYANCALVFAGQNTSAKRLVEGKKIIELGKNYQDARQEETNKIFKGKKIEDFNGKDFVKLHNHQNSQGNMTIKQVLFEGMSSKNNKGGMVELATPNQSLFALEINAEKEKDIVLVRNFAWGNTAVYGAGLGQEILSPIFFGHLDLREGSGEIAKDIMPFAATIKENFGKTIGGGMTNIALVGGQILTVSNTVYSFNPETKKSERLYRTGMENGKLYHYVDDKKYELIDWTNFKDTDGTGYFLEL